MKDYRFKLSYTGVTYQERYVSAIFGDDLALEMSPDTNEMYYRTRLQGKFTLVNEDYDFVMAAPIDAKIDVVLENYEYGSWWTYLQGYFYRTDCEINADDRIMTVQMATSDQYDDFLGVLDKEIDLIKIAPKITPIMLDKRPCLQLYARGADSVSCILGNMSWEQDCERVDDANELTTTQHFAFWGNYMSAGMIGSNLPSAAPKFYAKKLTDSETITNFTITSGTYQLTARVVTLPSGDGVSVEIFDNGVRQWQGGVPLASWGFPITINLAGWGSNPDCKLELNCAEVYGRIISDVDAVLGVTTAVLGANDLVGNNRNYKRVSPVQPSADLALAMSGIFSSEPTEWGIYQDGEYYTTPLVVGAGEFMPVLRNGWGRVSYWIEQSTALDYVDQTARKVVTLKDAYRLRDVIDAILAELMPGFTVQSEFLDRDALNLGEEGVLYITPKSNVLNINYTEPAQKAPITLRQILDMLRVVYRCYWQLTTAYLRIEHVEWFRRGGRYSGNPVVGADLTTHKTVRNGKLWSYLTSKYKYDKLQMPVRYEFGWMDEETEPFDGWPIEMLSGYVDKTRVEKFTVNNFSADVDYLMLNPAGVSKDGFVLLKAQRENIIAEPVAVGGINTSAILIDYATTAEQTVEVIYGYTVNEPAADTDVAIEIYAYSANGQRIGLIRSLTKIGQGSYLVSDWVIPANTAMLVARFTEIGGTFTLTSLEPPTSKVIYYDWNYTGNTDHWLQNGRLAFVWLQQYYDYDMPCRKYVIGTGSPKNAAGVSKNKIQDVSFPTDGYFEPEKVVTTELGSGKVRKLTLNLSSKMAQATLEYDTE